MLLLKMNRRNEKGFTLVEVMVALAIFTGGILAIAAMQIRAISTNTSSRQLTEASTLAQAAMEDVIAKDYATLYALRGTGATETQAGIYTVSQTVTSPPGGSSLSSDTALMVSVTIDWVTTGGRQRSMPVSFIKSENMEKSYE